MHFNWIAHLDIDAFFASIHEIKEPNLKNVPLIVTNVRSKRGIVLTCNYLARKYKIHAGMPLYKALWLAADLYVVENNPLDNIKWSNAVYQLLLNCVSKYIFPASIDEWYLNINDYVDKFASPLDALWSIKKLVYQETKLNISIGAAFNSFLAKIATNYIKPNNVTCLRPNNWTCILKNKSIKIIPGIGPKNFEILHHYKIFTFQDVLTKRVNNSNVQNLLIDLKRRLFALHNKLIIDDCVGSTNKPIKSISFSKSLFYKTTLFDDFYFYVQLLTRQVVKKAKQDNVCGNVIAIHVQKADHLERSYVKQSKLVNFTNDYNVLINAIFNLIEKTPSIVKNAKIIGINLKNVISRSELYFQQQLFSY